MCPVFRGCTVDDLTLAKFTVLHVFLLQGEGDNKGGGGGGGGGDRGGQGPPVKV